MVRSLRFVAARCTCQMQCFIILTDELFDFLSKQVGNIFCFGVGVIVLDGVRSMAG